MYILKYRNYIEIKALSFNTAIRQLYHNLIYPYMSYSILAWGSVNKTHIKKIQVKQNHIVRLMFYSKTAKQNFYKYRVNTSAGKQSVTFMAIDIWKDLPSSLKDLSVLAFPEQIKRYLLSEQKLN